MRLKRCKDCGFALETGARQSCEHDFETVEVFAAEELRERLEKVEVRFDPEDREGEALLVRHEVFAIFEEAE